MRYIEQQRDLDRYVLVSSITIQSQRRYADKHLQCTQVVNAVAYLHKSGVVSMRWGNSGVSQFSDASPIRSTAT